MRVLSGSFALLSGKYENQSENIIYYENEEYCISVCGEAVIEEQANPGDLIAESYKKYGNRITEYLCGQYLLVIYDKNNSRLAIYQDRTTSPITLYYICINNVLYYSTSLKQLLLSSKAERKLNEKAVEPFILNGFLYGDQTLVENVYKIKAFHCLNADAEGVTQPESSYCFDRYSEEESFKNFKTVLDKAILKQAEGLDEINAPLSSGYDSSYIVDVLSKQTDLPINAFSIGGKFGKNELPTVEQNVKYFRRTKLHSKLTDSHTLQNYPDIVWRLDGNVYESGLFLQYELNQMVNRSGKSTLICGECADQVLHQDYFNEERNTYDPSKTDRYYEFSEYPFVFSSYLILKKNGIMANSFGIQTRYPYLDDEFIALCKPLAQYNGKNKRLHKENCQKCLPEEIIKNISKIGGSTECHSLFENEAEIKRFFKYVEKSEFFKRHKELIKKHSYSEKIKPDFVTGFKTKLRNTAYDLIKKDYDKAGQYFNNEIKLTEYLKYAYIILFAELILSGKYDGEFMKPGVRYQFSDFM